jgi:hypothetical protein
MENMRSETRFDDSWRLMLSPRDSSLSLSLLGERRCREPLSLLGVRGREWSGLVMETTGMGVSRFTMGSDCSPLISMCLVQGSVLLRGALQVESRLLQNCTATPLLVGCVCFFTCRRRMWRRNRHCTFVLLRNSKADYQLVYIMNEVDRLHKLRCTLHSQARAMTACPTARHRPWQEAEHLKPPVELHAGRV